MSSKRSLRVNLSRMRKGFWPKPLAVGIASVFATAACSEQQEVAIYANAQDCIRDNPDFVQQCQTAYQQALLEAERTGPKYRSMRDCENEFGTNQCHYVERESGSFFMPLMAGYMLGNLLSPKGYHYQPMYTSYSRYSPYRYRWIGADGYDFGDFRRTKMKVGDKAFKPKPTVRKTISRGGFGSSVRAKSSWGSSRSSRGGWGG